MFTNESLASGTVSPSYKHDVVTPLLKKASLSSEDLKNFRPVSNLPFLSNILEKVVSLQLRDHLSKNGLYEIYQSAYRQFHNTETALLKVQNDLLCEAEKGKISILALLDMSAAFDTIDHSILIERLNKSFGISGIALQWFESYLSGRTQSVLVQGLLSAPFTLSLGVPQGSVLGPILYTMYTQPLGSLIQTNNVRYHMYADDTQLYMSAPPSQVKFLTSTLEKCIVEVKEWMCSNKLKLNEEKTEVVLCDPKSISSLPNDENYICIDGEVVSYTNKARNLGVVFDCKLSMEYHIGHLCQILFLELRRIGHMAMFLNEHSLKTLISAFMFSKIDYCNSLLVNLPDKCLNKLQRFQNQAARLVLRKKKHDHVTPMFWRLHWLPVKARLVYKISVLCHKFRHNKCPSYFKDMIQDYVPSRSLRSADKSLLYEPKKGSKRIAGRAFMHAAPEIWNSLPLSLRNIASESAFKSRLKSHLMKSSLKT